MTRRSFFAMLAALFVPQRKVLSVGADVQEDAIQYGVIESDWSNPPRDFIRIWTEGSDRYIDIYE